MATVVMLMLALSPAAALGKVGSPHSGASVAVTTRGASHGVTPTNSRNADPAPARQTSGRSSRLELLALGGGYTDANGSRAVTALQRRLISLGYSPGSVDGRYGPSTENAVIRFQAAHGLRADGIAGTLTQAALASAGPILYPGEGYTPGGSGLVRQLQRHLAAAGYPPGPIDGRYGPLTERAVTRFQRARHLQVDGIAGPRTLGHLHAGPGPVVQHRPHPRPPRPGTAHHRAHSAPPRSHGAHSPTTATAPQLGHARRSPGSFPIVWIVVLACLLAAAGAVLLWRRRRRRGEPRPASEVQPRREPPVQDLAPEAKANDEPPVPEVVPEARQHDEPKVREVVPEAQPREDVPVLTEPPVGFRERAAKLLADDASGHTEDQHVGAAAFRLGLLLAQDGDLAGAEDAFRRADQHGHPASAFELGVLLTQRRDRAAANDAFSRADQRGHPQAAFDLGALLLEEGDRAGAEEAFARADQRGDAGAACNLGVLLEQRGERVRARDAYRRADERGHAVGACNLGAMLEQEGDLVAAKGAYRRADERGDSVGAHSLGVLLEQEGDRAGAKDAYRRADQRGNPAGACSLGLLLKQEGDRAGAVHAFERAGEHGSGEVAEVAHAALLELTGTQGRQR